MIHYHHIPDGFDDDAMLSCLQQFISSDQFVNDKHSQKLFTRFQKKAKFTRTRRTNRQKIWETPWGWCLLDKRIENPKSWLVVAVFDILFLLICICCTHISTGWRRSSGEGSEFLTLFSRRSWFLCVRRRTFLVIAGLFQWSSRLW